MLVLSIAGLYVVNKPVALTLLLSPAKVPLILLNVIASVEDCEVLLFATDNTVLIALVLVKYSFLYSAVELLLIPFEEFG